MIPTEIQIAIWTVLASAIGALYLKQSQHEKKIAVAETNVSGLKEDMKEGFAQMKEQLAELKNMLLGFIKNEFDFLKDLRNNKK